VARFLRRKICSRGEVKGKGKVVPVLFFLTEHHSMKAYRGVEVKIHEFFDLHYMEVYDQLRTPATLSPGKEPLVPIG